MAPPQNMGEVLLLPLAKSVLEKLTNSFTFQPTITYTNEQANSAISVDYELKTMQHNMEAVYAVLADAETKQSTNNSIKVWLRDLKCIVYDIDDLLDEAVIDCFQHDAIHGEFPLNTRYSFRSFHLSYDIQNVGAKLECEVARIHEFGLIEIQNCDKISNLCDEYDPIIVGRNEAKNEIISKVLSVSNANTLSVLPLVGKGGIGKTTLAKLVHCDVPNFDLKFWVCVSQNLDINNILTKILRNYDVNFEGVNKSFKELIEKIDELLNGKKYFLVFDDVWLEDELEWKRLEKCLAIGKEGSMIMITTRNVNVASITKTMEAYKVGGLSKYECWSIFRKMVFEGYAEEVSYPDLQEIGKDIVSQCWGVPLLINILGGILRFERDVNEWQRVRDFILNLSDEYDFNTVKQISKLSYGKLRPQVKQCFAYMSLYPKDHVYVSSEMLDIGIALDLFKIENGNKESEEVASSCLKELALNSLLTRVQQKCKRSTTMEAFMLHDIVHDLAMDIMEDEFVDVVTLHNNNMSIVPNYTKHIVSGHKNSTDCLAPNEFPIELSKATKARTFCVFEGDSISRSMLDDIISNFIYLRVLDLSGGMLEELPNSIGKLKHLRYLNLSRNIIIQGLPSTICDLVNLDTFHTKGCVRLKELPKNLNLLLKLRKLSVTTLEDSLISTMINQSRSLQHLVISSCPRLVSLWGGNGNATEGLISLRSLNISSCPKMTRLPSCINSLVNLEHLTLHDCQDLDLEGGGQEGLLLKGLENLKELHISLLPKLSCFPHSIILSTKATLETLELDSCKGLIELVEPHRDCFGQFESLRRIVIKRCPRLLAFPNSICRLDTLEDVVILESPLLAKSCSLTPDGKALDFTLIHHVLNIQIDDATLTKKLDQPNPAFRDPLRTSVMTFWSNAVDMTPKKPHAD